MDSYRSAIRFPTPRPSRASSGYDSSVGLWTRSHSISSSSDVSSCGYDSDTCSSSAKSFLWGGNTAMNGDLSQPWSPKSSSRMNTLFTNELQTNSRLQEEWVKPKDKCSSPRKSSPRASELSEVFDWVDQNKDGLICAADLRGFMSRVMAFEMSEKEAESLLLLYSSTRTTSYQSRSGSGAVVDFEGFLSLYKCLCSEETSSEEETMMVAASHVFDKTRLQNRKWA